MNLIIHEEATLTPEIKTILTQIRNRVAEHGHLRMGWEDERGQFHWRLMPTEIKVTARGKIKFKGFERYTGRSDDIARYSEYNWNRSEGTLGRQDSGDYSFEGVNVAPPI